ncbi:MAG TPA: hypothetical protein VKZ44_09205, partial [Taishania sp.]|nr:hypothetical protein [Taishania sp.]
MNRLLFVLVFVLGTSTTYAQSDYLKFRPYKPYTWMIGAGWSFIDGDSHAYTDIFHRCLEMKAMYYPSHLSINRYLKHGFSLELGLSYNKFNLEIDTLTHVVVNRFSGDINC